MNREESWPVQLAKESLRYFLQHSQMLPQLARLMGLAARLQSRPTACTLWLGPPVRSKMV